MSSDLPATELGLIHLVGARTLPRSRGPSCERTRVQGGASRPACVVLRPGRKIGALLLLMRYRWGSIRPYGERMTDESDKWEMVKQGEGSLLDRLAEMERRGIEVEDLMIALLKGGVNLMTLGVGGDACELLAKKMMGREEIDDWLLGQSLIFISDDLGVIRNRIEKLLEMEEAPTTEDIASILREVIEASKTTKSAQKRRILRHAAVNAFDPKFHEEAMVSTLLELVQSLSYLDVVVLRKLVDIAVKQNAGSNQWPTFVQVSLVEKDHRQIQTSQSLLEFERERLPHTIEYRSIHRLKDHGLISFGGATPKTVSVIQLGIAFYEFVKEPVPEDP